MRIPPEPDQFLDPLAKALFALEGVDSSQFQRRARMLQSIWREEQGYPCGEHRRGVHARPLGSRLVMPWAQESLANFLTPAIRDVVRAEVCDRKKSRGKLFGKPRIFNDLLSSQPLCFNLFAELKLDLKLASAVISKLTRGRFKQVQGIELEHSPGRSDPRYSADRSAFDVFLECETKTGKRGFIAIEVKYHENLRNPPGEHRLRYDEIAEQMACFHAQSRESLLASPLQQIWRDHLLTGITREVDGYDDALFVMLYPEENYECSRAVASYTACLSDQSSFAGWTLEAFVSALKANSVAPWIELFADRYLRFDKLDSRIRGTGDQGLAGDLLGDVELDG
jgi:hypothetical protein